MLPHPILCLFLINCFAASLHAAGALIRVDTIAPAELTLVLQDFNGSTAAHSSVNAAASTLPPAWQSANNGYHTYEVAPTTNDGKIYFNSVPYDVQYYSHVRVRARSSSSGHADFWPSNPVTPTTVNLGTFGTSFRESNQPWRDPTNPSINTATNGGFRFDPNTLSSATTYDLDYIMVDVGRVVGFEFDMDEIPTTSPEVLQNWRNHSNRTTDYRIEDGALKGITNHGDTFILTSNPLNLDADLYQYVEIRMKTNANTRLQFFWSTPGNDYSESKSVSINTADDQWHIYLLDMTAEDTWEGTLANFRVDIGTAENIPYEIDYIRFREVGMVPEPARVTLLIGATDALLLRRRRNLGLS